MCTTPLCTLDIHASTPGNTVASACTCSSLKVQLSLLAHGIHANHGYYNVLTSCKV